MSSEASKPSRGIWAPVPSRVRRLILFQSLNGLTFGYFIIYVTAFLPERGISSVVVATVISLEGIAVVLAGIPFAILSDRRGRKWFLIAGNLLFAPTILVFALTMNVAALYGAAALGGLGEAMGLSSWNAMIADQTELENRDSAFSLSFIVSTAGFSLGSALPLVFPPLEGPLHIGVVAMHSSVLLVLGLSAFSAPAAFWVLLRDYEEKHLNQQADKLSVGGMRQTLKFSFFNSIIGFGAGLIIPLVATWFLYKFQVTDTYSGPYLALSGMTIAFSAIASPRLSRRLGLFPAIVATAGSSTLFMFSLAFIPNVYAAGAVYLVRSGLMNMNGPLMDSFLMGITPPKRRGLASMLNAVIWRLPNNTSTFIGGFFLSSSQFNVSALGISHLDLPWVLASVLYIVGIGLLYTNFRNVKPTG
jgi:MFS family permease